MSLTKDKANAKQALITLHKLESLLPAGDKAQYRNALALIARHNGELRRLHAQPPAPPEPVNNLQSTVLSLKFKNGELESQIQQLKEQVQQERDRLPTIEEIKQSLACSVNEVEMGLLLSLSCSALAAYLLCICQLEGMPFDDFEQTQLSEAFVDFVSSQAMEFSASENYGISLR